jgi:hypothetical protein
VSATTALPIPLSGAAWARPFRQWPEWITLTCYAGLLAFTIPFHEPWADEAQAWQIAINVPVWNLLAHALRYEGTPGLWFVWLRFLHWLHVGYNGMHWATALIAVASAAFLIFCAPFSRPFRFAIPFTFFLAYQYPIVARSYVLAPLLLYGIAATWSRRSPVITALLLGLLGNVAVHTFFISAGFAAVYCYEILARKREEDTNRLICAGVVLLALYAVAFACVWPVPADCINGQVPAPKSWLTLTLLLCSFGLIHVLLALSSWPLGSIFLGGAFLWGICRRQTYVYLLPIVFLTLFCGYKSELRHAGLVIPTGVTVCWILAKKGFSASRPLLTIAVAWLIIQVCWTAVAVAYDYRYPYSPDLATAEYLEPYIAQGGKLAASFLNEPATDAFWTVGLEPYFATPIFADQRYPYWVSSRLNHPESDFVRAVYARPRIVLLEYHGWPRFDPARDLRGDHVDFLNREGYRYSRAFCGAQIAGWSAKVTICHVIFEKLP